MFADQRVQELERQVEQLLAGGLTDEALAALCAFAVEVSPEAIAGITMVNPTGRYFERAFFPTLSRNFEESIAFISISIPWTGTCAEAVGLGETISCLDIANDHHFDASWTGLCLRAGLRSVQSNPVRGKDGTVLGTFVIGFGEPRAQDQWDQALMDLGCRLTALILEPAESSATYAGAPDLQAAVGA